MKSKLHTKLVQQILSKNKDNEGFTMVELLVVFILIGILSAIALPSFLSQAAKAKQSEAKTYIGAINRAQQAYRMENESFAADVSTLQIGISTSTESYTYNLVLGVSTSTITATAQDPDVLKGFNGGVTVLSSGLTMAVACQTAGIQITNPITNPILTETGAACSGAMINMD